ncbi:MAG: ABC transporter ATP-binding protein [Tenericutes bacterium]|nr:ABC transporter ATP-binding protein [Bacilli bacterium]MDD3995294.1 ABC transporter ATP-binding protein [Bacilli bacterium]MDD4624572.1 ABC transporter ATP-binding protein [Bacilli bacterium]MDD4832015.1 ABC transporter ATP-binding protein [Bacilli bacterium]NLV90446.1 ABC transporter ATP-binding protein [Mycoplasmatota bacterium]
MIKVEKFTKKYGDFIAVDNISFEIKENEIVGFVGQNGAGKSTTIRCMMNMLFPTLGKITINGLDSVIDTKKIKEITSYMPSDTIFYENIKVDDLFKFCLKFSKKEYSEVEKLAKYFELDLNKRIHELSTGNKKKVSIVEALLKDNEVIILDEPTSGLDPLMQKKFFDLILKEKAKGVTIFLSSHNLREIEKYCDRVIIIKSGKIVETIDLKKKQQIKYIVSYVDKKDNKTIYEYDGKINDLIKDLSLLEIKDLEIRKKTIEEEFISYYESSDENE